MQAFEWGESMRRLDRLLRLRRYLRAKFTRTPALAAWLFALSVVSGTAGLAVPDAVAASPSLTVEAGLKSGSGGDISVDISYRAAEGDILIFAAAMDTMKMKAPPLADYDLLQLARLVLPSGAEIRPSHWSIDQTGHMGHHLRGTLAFELTSAQRASVALAPASFDIVVKDVGGVRRRTFNFKTTPGAD